MINSEVESGRAKFSLREVKRVLEGKVNVKEYKSYCRKFPGMVQTNGLAASLAFCCEKGETWNHIYNHCEKWLRSLGKFDDHTELIDYVCSLTTADYRVATKEILALFNWIRRFAIGLSRGEEDERENNKF